MEIMKPLCRQDFSNPSVFGYGGCDALESLHRKWESLHPDPPRKSRKGPLQIAAFFSVFVFVFVSLAFVGWSYMKKSRTAVWALLFSLFGFATYVYYESGVSPYANIRLDLLFLLPGLLLNLVLTVLAALRLRKR